MKKRLLLILTLGFILTFAACGTSSAGEQDAGRNGTTTFQAAVLAIHEGYYLVEPVGGSTELNSADQIIVPMENMNPSPEPKVGDILEIEYDGSIAESYPAQITNAYNISVIEQ